MNQDKKLQYLQSFSDKMYAHIKTEKKKRLIGKAVIDKGLNPEKTPTKKKLGRRMLSLSKSKKDNSRTR